MIEDKDFKRKLSLRSVSATVFWKCSDTALLSHLSLNSVWWDNYWRDGRKISFKAQDRKLCWDDRIGTSDREFISTYGCRQ